VCSDSAEAPLTLREGGIFADGHHAELDRLRSDRAGRAAVAGEYQAEEAKRTGIPSLKVKFNKVFGFYIEVTNTHRDRVPDDYVRKQTMKNAERYITDELKQYESEALSAESRANAGVPAVCRAARPAEPQIPAMQRGGGGAGAAGCAGRLGGAGGRAQVLPTGVRGRADAGGRGGRHPVLEQALEANFVGE
jgi:DNA mismatch repair protein MutS